MNHYFNPVKICQGKGCLKNLPDLLQSLIADKGSDVLLIVWSESVLENEVIKAAKVKSSFLNIEKSPLKIINSLSHLLKMSCIKTWQLNPQALQQRLCH